MAILLRGSNDNSIYSNKSWGVYFLSRIVNSGNLNKSDLAL